MSVYQPVQRETWSDPWFSELSPHSKLLFLYLLTSPSNTPSGMFQCTPRKMAFDTGMSLKQTTVALTQVQGHVEYDGAESLVWIVNAAKYWPKNPGVLKAMQRELEKYGNHPFCKAFCQRYPFILQPLPDGLPTVPEPLPDGLPTSEESEEWNQRNQRNGIRAAAPPTPQPDAAAEETAAAALPNGREEKPNAFALYEQAIGPVPNQVTAQRLIDAEAEYGGECLEHALEETALAKAKSWRYTEAILVRHKAEGCYERSQKDRPGHVGQGARVASAQGPDLGPWERYAAGDG